MTTTLVLQVQRGDNLVALTLIANIIENEDTGHGNTSLCINCKIKYI
ncbi:MAG: hypothetical protein OEY09_13870 [Gammaproteobacteria bacterium]|nr:hypothetical protein [Gammaproteobacteria bacterium]